MKKSRPNFRPGGPMDRVIPQPNPRSTRENRPFGWGFV